MKDESLQALIKNLMNACMRDLIDAESEKPALLIDPSSMTHQDAILELSWELSHFKTVRVAGLSSEDTGVPSDITIEIDFITHLSENSENVSPNIWDMPVYRNRETLRVITKFGTTRFSKMLGRIFEMEVPVSDLDAKLIEDIHMTTTLANI